MVQRVCTEQVSEVGSLLCRPQNPKALNSLRAHGLNWGLLPLSFQISRASWVGIEVSTGDCVPFKNQGCIQCLILKTLG